MVGLVGWLVLAAIELVLEFVSPEHGVRHLARAVARRPIGRIALVLLWGVLGWHLFTRYGAPLDPR